MLDGSSDTTVTSPSIRRATSLTCLYDGAQTSHSSWVRMRSGLSSRRASSSSSYSDEPPWSASPASRWIVRLRRRESGWVGRVTARLATRLGGEVALVADPDELPAEAEGEDDLGRRRQQGDDAHGRV